MEVIDIEKVQSIINVLKEEYGTLGFEFYTFKVGWYNEYVQPAFHLNYDQDILAILIVSTPDMFEKTFKPFLYEKKSELSNLRDPVDECMLVSLSKIKQIFQQYDVKIIHDFELHSNRRPKILMQTAGHVSGAAFFYQRTNVKNDPWGNSQVYGVCIHPKYGGWFAVRGVVIFKNLKCPLLCRSDPYDVVSTEQARIHLLELYNFHWKDWSYRDIIPVIKRYSKQQMEYFLTLPKNRFTFIAEMLKS